MKGDRTTLKTFVIILILWVLAIFIFCIGYWLGMRITQLKNGIDIFDDENNNNKGSGNDDTK